jgi:probable phosphoglycerate mutase
MTTIVLVRHAATALSGERYSGRSDPPLTADGRRSAEELAIRLAGTLPPGIRIVTSPSKRAYDTAAVLAAQAAPAVLEIDDRWQEVDVGDAEGRTFDEVAARYPALAAQLAAGDAEIDWPGGETADALRERVIGAWAAIISADRPTVIVSHAGTIRIALGLATGRPPEEIPFPATAEATRVEVEAATIEPLRGRTLSD